jgi:predicted O-methyltransferase YrrM
VIEEKTPYYVFDEIEKFRKELIACKEDNPALTENQHKNYGALLFRLVNFFKCRTVLQIGSSTGIMSLYLSLASRKNCTCYALEERRGILDSVILFTEQLHLKNLHFMEGAYKDSLDKLSFKLPSFDMIFINQMGNPDKTSEMLTLSQDFIYDKSIVIVDGIARNKEMKELWKKIKEDARVRVTIDLFALGIVFFDTKLNKKHYKIYFDYGKKQNLHEKRRRRINIISWRKKSSKNESKN